MPRRNRWRGAPAALELPLIERGSGSGRGDTDENEAVARAQALVARQARCYQIGLVLYCAAYAFFGPLSFATNQSGAIEGWGFVVFGVMQTGGLMCMATATVDANLHMRSRPITAAAVAITMIAYYGFFQSWGHLIQQSYPEIFYYLTVLLMLPAFPWIYLLLPCCFFKVLRADLPQLPRFTELFCMSLVLWMFGYGVVEIYLSTILPAESIQAGFGGELGGSMFLISGLILVFIYGTHRQQGESLTYSFNHAILVYLKFRHRSS